MSAQLQYEGIIKEITDEIGTQTLARFGLNIFSLNTYEAYGASVTMSNESMRVYNQHKDTPEKFDKFFNDKYKKYQNAQDSKPNFKKEPHFEQMYEQYKKDPQNFGKNFEKFYKQNKDNKEIFGKDSFLMDLQKRYSGEYSKAFGQYFEELDSGVANIKSALFNKGEKTYTTDTLFEIQKVQNQIKEGKKLKGEQKAKFDFIMANYGDEVKNMDFNSPDMQALIQSDTREGKGKSLKNHTNTDTVTFDKNGKIIKKSQLKVIKDTEGLLEDRYLQHNDELKMPFDDYKRHKANLEEMIKNPKDEQQKAKAQKALEMLEANNLANRIICDNPRATAFITQGAVAGGHIAQAGLSDAVVVALSTLANGAVYEIKDAFSGESNDAIETRIKRLINAVIKNIKGAFVRGGGFGAIDAIVGILKQIFKSIAGQLELIWTKLRSAAKSIYNAIYDYITGKTTNFQECLKVIIKGLFSAIVVGLVAGLEKNLYTGLSAIITPLVASFLAPALSIIIGSIAVVAMCRSIDFGLDTLFGVFAQAEISKKRYEEIEALCQKMLPQIIADRECLERKIKQTHYERVLRFDMNFEGYKEALQSKDNEKSFEYLNEICKLYGGKLKCKTLYDARKIVQRGSGVLKWSDESSGDSLVNAMQRFKQWLIGLMQRMRK